MIRRLIDSVATKVVALVVALAAIAGIGYETFKPSATKTVTAYFPVAIHLYPGSDVDVLGVKVGTVTSVTPMGDRVKVVMRYAADLKVPAGASAVVDEPTLVADRVIELQPVYSGGPVMADGAQIPLARTQVPAELDELSANLVQLADALGPHGANKQGALTRFLKVAAANLKGQGAQANTTIANVSSLMSTLGGNRNALFGTVRNLQKFTTQLATHDAQTRAFTNELATVSGELADDSAAFTQAVHELGLALNEVATFIKTNRSSLARDVSGLATVTTILARERVLLAHLADIGAVGVSNYPHMYTPSARTYNARFDFSPSNPALFFCQLYGSIGGNDKQCLKNLEPLNHLPISPGSSP
jgi:phospholipid/cholesterol/gamma-HCH transport system substrate-binding protein